LAARLTEIADGSSHLAAAAARAFVAARKTTQP
jgi:hypothetical protein